MLRRLHPLVTLAVIAVAACGSDEATGSRTTSGDVGDDLLAVIDANGTASRDAALAAYARIFGPLPGAPGTGPDHAPRRSGTGALRWVLGHFRELDDAQRAAVLDIVSGAHVRVGVKPASIGAGARGHGGALELASLADATSTLDAVVADVGAKLGRTLKAKIVLATTSIDYSGTAYTFPFSAEGKNPFAGGAPPPKSERPTYGAMAECRITLTPDGLALAAGDPKLRASLQHEVFHCFMIDLVGIDAFLDRSPWLVEGAAAWVGESSVSGTSLSRKWWAGWLVDPRKTLIAKSYDAIGFYAWMDARGKAAWPVFDAMFTTPTNVGSYAAAASFAGDDFVDSLPASFARDASLGPDWEATGPGITADRAPIEAKRIANGEDGSFAATPQASEIGIFDLQAEVVSMDVSSASDSVHGLMHTADGTTWPLTSDTYCLKAGGCECPPGSAFIGTFRKLAPGKTHVAVAGHLGGGSVDAHGRMLEDFCKKDPRPGSNVALTGAMSETIVARGTCSVDTFGSTPVYRVVFSFTAKGATPFATENGHVLLDVSVDPYAGPGTFEAASDTSPGPGHVFVTGGLGQSLAVYTRQTGAVTVNGDAHSGALHVEMRDKIDGSVTVRADGTWVCDDGP